MAESDSTNDLVWERRGGVWNARVDPKGPGAHALIIVGRDENIECYVYDVLVGGMLMFRGCGVSLDECMRDGRRDAEWGLSRHSMMINAMGARA
jgi:hypothetical protein